MLVALALAVLVQVPGERPAGPCETARHRYEALAFEEALGQAEAGLAEDPGAVGCLEVEALVLLASGRPEEARAVLTTLFEVAPDHAVTDPSLSPSTRALIDQVREAVRPLSARVAARWIVHSSLRLDVRLEGGLRDAARVRYRARVEPAAHETSGEVALVGPAATATVAVPRRIEASTLLVDGEVVDAAGRRVIPFSSQLLLPERPPEEGVVEVVEEGGAPWWLWVALGVVAVGGAVTAVVVAQPDEPDATGTLGRTRL